MTNLCERRSGAQKRLGRKVDQLKESDAQRVRQEYDNLVRGFGLNQAAPRTDDAPGGPAAPLPDELLREAVPGSVRRAEQFLQMLRLLAQHLLRRLGSQRVEVESTTAFFAGLEQRTTLQAKLFEVLPRAACSNSSER